jgi:hypothetical protein
MLSYSPSYASIFIKSIDTKAYYEGQISGILQFIFQIEGKFGERLFPMSDLFVELLIRDRYQST